MTTEKKNHLRSPFSDGRAFSAFMLGLCLCFYLFFACFYGAVICVDSPSYIEMDISREPLYCLLLAAFRAVFSGFGADFYLTAVEPCELHS